MKHLNNDLKPLAEGDYPDRGPLLFGEGFAGQDKAAADGIKALKGAQSKKRFFASGSSNTSPRVAAISGVCPNQTCRSQYSSVLVHHNKTTTKSSPTKSQSSPTINSFAFLGNISLSTQVLESSEYLCDSHGPQPANPSTSLSTGRKDSSSHSSMGKGYIQPLCARGNQGLQGWSLQHRQQSYSPTTVESGGFAKAISVGAYAGFDIGGA